MSLKRFIAMSVIFAAITSQNQYDYSRPTPKQKPTSQSTPSDRLKSKGLKEFNINGETIYALNEANAQRKYNKIHNK